MIQQKQGVNAMKRRRSASASPGGVIVSGLMLAGIGVYVSISTGATWSIQMWACIGLWIAAGFIGLLFPNRRRR
jgi:hypothetical protein